MAEWQSPKTDWVTNPKNPVAEDFKRIEGNIEFLKDDIETKKGLIVDALNDMNQSASVTDTYSQLAGKIRGISTDADATVGNVLTGKTFYQGGLKRTGTMPNRGAQIITPGTSDIAIPAGYHNGEGYVEGDPNLLAGNIKKGVTLFEIEGDFEGYLIGPNDLYAYGNFKDGVEFEAIEYSRALLYLLKASMLFIGLAPQNYYSVIRSSQPIDLTDIDKIGVRWGSFGINAYSIYNIVAIGIASTKVDDVDDLDEAIIYQSNDTLFDLREETLDVSGYSGNYYLHFLARNHDEGWPAKIVAIERIWLE